MITLEQKTVLNKYAELKLQIKALEAEADELSPTVLGLMQDNQVGEIEINNLGKLSISSRRTWIYPEEIKRKEDQLKDSKKEAERLGTADYTEKFFTMFKGC